MNRQTHVLIVASDRGQDRLVALPLANSESLHRLPVAMYPMGLQEFCAEYDIDAYVATEMTSVSRSICDDLVYLADGLYQMCHQLGVGTVMFARHPAIGGHDDQAGDFEPFISEAAQREARARYAIA